MEELGDSPDRLNWRHQRMPFSANVVLGQKVALLVEEFQFGLNQMHTMTYTSHPVFSRLSPKESSFKAVNFAVLTASNEVKWVIKTKSSGRPTWAVVRSCVSESRK